MTRLAKSLVLFVVIFHLAIFVFEALLWMHPPVHELALSKWTSVVQLNTYDRALVLRDLFVNQGFYNLFVALAGIAGLILLRRGQASAGYVLVVYMCVSAATAGLVLAINTHVLLGAFLQAAPTAFALALVLPRLYGGSSRSVISRGT